MTERTQVFDDLESWHRVTLTDFGSRVRVKIAILPGRAYWTEPDAATVRRWVDRFLTDNRKRTEPRDRRAHTVTFSTYYYEVGR